MNQDDPFSSLDSDKTVVMPSPRGAHTPGAAASTFANGRRTTSSNSENEIDESAAASGLNPLVAAANHLLNLVPQLHATVHHPDPSGLRNYLAQNITAFERRAKAAGVATDKVIGARYALCTLLDETAASTPWGSGIWAQQSLLVTFHSEAWGGEKFFQLLSKLAENATGNRDLLEFMYVCLALGFEGRYRVMENGRSQLDTLRERLSNLIKQERGEYERDLSAHWQSARINKPPILALFPLWVVAALSSFIMLAAYLTFSFLLNNTSDPVFEKIEAIRVKDLLPEPTPVPAPKPRLREFLAAEIRENLVTVRDDEDRSVVTLKGDGVFAPGSATISESFLPTLGRISDALAATPGHVVVTGHTDNQPIRSIRFPSNWHLSKERAVSVMQILAEKGTPVSRMRAEGRADAEPVTSNSTPVDRAKNRRVEITLFVPPATER